MKNIEMQLAFQCAPVITNLKISNLLIIQKECLKKAKQILENSSISYTVLLVMEQKAVILLYNKNKLISYLSEQKAEKFLKEMGYQKLSLPDILSFFQFRYQKYMEGNDRFPHEIGLILGYPVEDVKGFIQNDGKNFLYTGYWKVYENLPAKIQMFHQFDLAKEKLIQLVSSGTNMIDIMNEDYSGLQKAVI